MSNTTTKPPTPPLLHKGVESPKSGAARATMAGAILAAIAASSCCVLPAVLAIVGVSGVGAAAALEAYRPIFLAVTLVLLGVGFYLVYRKPKVAVDADVDGCGCPAPNVRRSGKPMLWLSLLAVLLFAGYPLVAGAFAQTSSTGDTALSATSQQVNLHIEGMTCEGCATRIVSALGKTPGVVKASVQYDEGSATVTYDPNTVSPETLADTVSAIDGYTARVDLQSH